MNGNKRKQLCGFLSPSGVFTEADSYEHMQVSKEIVEKEYGQILPGIDAERLLLEKGYIGFYSRDVGFLWIVNHNIRNLTQEQVEFIQDHIEDANNSDQRHAIEALLSSNMDVKERHVLDLYGIGSG